MKKKLVILLLTFFISGPGYAQFLFSTCFNYCNVYPGVPEMHGIKIIEALDGNGCLSLIEGGPDFSYPPYSPLYFFLTRIDSTGNQLWNHVMKIDSNEIYITNGNDTIIT